MSIASCQETIKDFRYSLQRFTLLDYVYDNACILAFNNPKQLTIITVLDDANSWTKGQLDIISKTKKEIVRYSPVSKNILKEQIISK